ncbi:unnamed protein product [Symbiodinium sp. CCMP2592]|nr:unnamed protein product [Symbiodinium sp. CCMP2592]
MFPAKGKVPIPGFQFRKISLEMLERDSAKRPCMTFGLVESDATKSAIMRQHRVAQRTCAQIVEMEPRCRSCWSSLHWPLRSVPKSRIRADHVPCKGKGADSWLSVSQDLPGDVDSAKRPRTFGFGGLVESDATKSAITGCLGKFLHRLQVPALLEPPKQRGNDEPFAIPDP